MRRIRESQKLNEGHSYNIADYIAGIFTSEEAQDAWYVAEDIAKGIDVALKEIYRGDIDRRRAALIALREEIKDLV